MRSLAWPFLGLALASGCAHAPQGGGDSRLAPGADSLTVALWHMDEPAGPDVIDSGPYKIQGTAGLDARSRFGRFRQARGFTRSADSFLLFPSHPMLDGPEGFTVEAWVYLDAYGDFIDTPIAQRWAPSANQQSWMFSVIGRNFGSVPITAAGDHQSVFAGAAAGRLAFAFQPHAAGAPRGFFSIRPVPLDRWTHVAATYDGQVVRLWISGTLDAQYAAPGRIAASETPLMVGNAVDPRTLSSFHGGIRQETGNRTPYFALAGAIDELRISSRARAGFPYGAEP